MQEELLLWTPLVSPWLLRHVRETAKPQVSGLLNTGEVPNLFNAEEQPLILALPRWNHGMENMANVFVVNGSSSRKSSGLWRVHVACVPKTGMFPAKTSAHRKPGLCFLQSLASQWWCGITVELIIHVVWYFKALEEGFSRPPCFAMSAAGKCPVALSQHVRKRKGLKRAKRVPKARWRVQMLQPTSKDKE